MNMDIKAIIEKNPLPWRLEEWPTKRTLQIVVKDANGNYVLTPQGESAEEIRVLGRLLIAAVEAFVASKS
jgi:hypothetical protein